MKPEKVLYQATVTTTGGRDGHATSSDGILDVKLAVQKELGGTGGATNPEQLFAAGYSACFLSALKLVAGKEKIAVPHDAKITAIIGIGPVSDAFALNAELQISLPGIDHEKAKMLVEKAHQVCPYSNATRGNIEVRLTVL
ncbi:MAG TPA: organic hydroperoxide resistance protein [Gammaproteobacteria bacterium]|nr:organic hydroperoxide resistance protein [Gammaproteobacteria bacterium]